MNDKKKTETGLKSLLAASRKKRQQAEYILEQYNLAHPAEKGQPIEPHKIAAWAIAKRIYNKPPVTPEERLSHELSRWLGAEHTKDPQGRIIKANHAVTLEIKTPHGPKTISRWLPLFDAPAYHMKVSFQQRRRSLLGDARQLQIDWESWIDNNRFKETLPAMNFNLTEDIKESKFPTTYPTEAPDDFDGDDEV